MATSNSISFSTSSQEIITEALELLGVLGEGESYTTDQYTSSLRTLNMMTKMWQAEGLNLFAVQPCYLFLNNGQEQYTLSGTTTDHFTTTLNTQTVNGTSSSGSFTVTLTSATTVTPTMKIGIQTSGTEMFWTTVVSIVGNVVTLTDALPSDVADEAVVYYYFTTANRPMRVLEAYTIRPGNVSIPMSALSRIDYYSLSRKDSESSPLQWYFDPQRTVANLFLWPTAGSELDYCQLICQRTLDDFDSASDEPDYPQEWFMPLSINLAVHLGPKYGTPKMDYERLVALSIISKEAARGWDVEQETSVYLKPDTWGNNLGRSGG